MNSQDVAHFDDLTGLYNRRAYRLQLEKELSGDTSQKGPFYVILTDLDSFKQINDTYGHLSGDFMIKEFARLLTEGLCGTESMISRYGGDEFVVIQKNARKEDVVRVWEELRQRLAQVSFALPDGQQAVRVTMSIGVAEYPTDAKSAEQLFGKADEALYSSKRLGRNRLSLAADILVQVREEKRVQNNLLRPAFMQRQKEMAQISQAFFKDPARKLVVINGDVGGGKTRMLEEIAAAAAGQGAFSLMFTCTELQREIPYSVAGDIIAAISRDHYDTAHKAFLALNPKQQRALRALPQCKIITETVEPAAEWDADMRLALFNAISDMLDSLIAELKPIILVDNLDWLDSATAHSISYLIASKRHVPLRLCGADSRPLTEKDKRGSCLDSLLYEISEFEIVPHIALQPFTEAQTFELIRAIFEKVAVPEQFCQQVYASTKGNLFFTNELLRDLIESQVICLHYPEWIFNEAHRDFPRDLRELLARKLETLGQDEKDLLLATAGMGSNIKFNFLSKLKKINSGYLQDVMRKAADKNIVQESFEEGALVFNHALTRSLLYDGLDKEAKKKLHLEIASFIESEHQDDLELVTPDLAFHFDQAKVESKLKEYVARALEYVERIFSTDEIEKIIEDALAKREAEVRQEPIKKEALPLVTQIMSAFNSAVKSMHTYQMQNELTIEMSQRMVLTLEEYFTMHGILIFSKPQGQEKDETALLINGQQFLAAASVEGLLSKRMFDIMTAFHIGSITFRRTVTQDEIASFVQVLSSPKLFVEGKEEWRRVLVDHKIFSIAIDEELYRKVLSEEEKRRFKKEFIKEFVVKKAAAEHADTAPASATPSEASPSQKIVSQHISGVTDTERNLLAKTIAHLPVGMMADVIVEEYGRRKTNIQDIREMVRLCIKETPEKNELLQLLNQRLEAMGMSKESFQWLIEETDFIKHSVKRRTNMLLATDAKTLLEMGVKENILPTLIELLTIREDDFAEQIVEKFLANFKNPLPEMRIYTASALFAVVEAIPERLTGSYMRKFTKVFLEALREENEPFVYELLAKYAGSLLRILIRLEYYWDIDRLIAAVEKDSLGQGDAAWRKEYADKALPEADLNLLRNHLIEAMGQVAFDINKNELPITIFKRLMPKAIPYLLELLLNRHSSSLLFEWYLQNLKVIDLLGEYKEEAFAEVEKMVASENETKVDLAFEILERLHYSNIIHLYEKTAISSHKNIRELTYRGLVKQQSDAAYALIRKMFPLESYDMQRSIIIAIGEHWYCKQAFDFLSSLVEIKQSSHYKKELYVAMERVSAFLKDKK